MTRLWQALPRKHNRMPRVWVDPVVAAVSDASHGVILPDSWSSWPALQQAVYLGDVERVRSLLDTGAAASTQADPEDGTTALHVAAAQAELSCARLLLSRGASVAARDAEHGATPVHLAAQHGADDVLEALLAAGADASAADRDGVTPLLFACFTPCEQCVRLLVRAGARVNATHPRLGHALGVCVRSDQQDMASFLVANGADVLMREAHSHRSALSTAVHRRSTGMLQALLTAAPADIALAQDVVPDGGGSLLHQCVRQRSGDLLRILLQHAAAPSLLVSRDADGATPLLLAAKIGDADLAVILLQHGASARAADRKRMTPLHWAAAQNDFELVQLLVQQGRADVNALDHQGSCACETALLLDHGSVAQYLRPLTDQKLLAHQTT